MAQVIIFGALFAAVLSASSPMIQQFMGSAIGQSSQINGQITSQSQGLVDAISNGFQSTSGS